MVARRNKKIEDRFRMSLGVLTEWGPGEQNVRKNQGKKTSSLNLSKLTKTPSKTLGLRVKT